MDNSRKKEESKSDTEDLSKANDSSLANTQNMSRTMVLEKTSHPTLNELLEDEMEDKFGRPNVVAQQDKTRDERFKHNRQRADYELAKETLKHEQILKKDGSQFNVFTSGIKSICERQDICLYDYLYFVKKFAFTMVV